jgi:hypothetical protein
MVIGNLSFYDEREDHCVQLNPLSVPGSCSPVDLYGRRFSGRGTWANGGVVDEVDTMEIFEWPVK